MIKQRCKRCEIIFNRDFKNQKVCNGCKIINTTKGYQYRNTVNQLFFAK